MATWLQLLLSIPSSDPDVQRRGRNQLIISAGMIALVLGSLPIAIVQHESPMVITTIGGTITFLALGFVLTRCGYVTLGTAVLIGIALLAVLAGLKANPAQPTTPMYLAFAVLTAGIILQPRHVWWVFGMAVLGLVLTLATSSSTVTSSALMANALNAILFVSLCALLAYLGAASTTAALNVAGRARQEAEAAATALEQANRSLEAEVAARTGELRQALAEQQALADHLNASLAAQQQLNELILNLSVPIIPVQRDVLVMPLVGGIDSSRAQQVLAAALAAIERHRARAIVVDVTGVAIIDSQVAQALIQTAQAVKLLGAQVVLVGIRPEVAQALVSLGISLDVLLTAATLADGLALLAPRASALPA